MTNFTAIPASEGFELRLVQAPSCNDPDCGGCQQGHPWLHWLSPTGEDAWILIAASPRLPEKGLIASHALDRYQRLCVVLGIAWDAIAAAEDVRQLARRQQTAVRWMPREMFDHMMSAPIEQLRENRRQAFSLAGEISTGRLTEQDVAQLLSTEADTPL